MKLRCYVCGEMLGSTFYLVAAQQESDRVFVVDLSCIGRVDKEYVTRKVKVA